MRKQQTAVPAAHPAEPKAHAPSAIRVLRTTARLWLPAALLRPKPPSVPLDERVRRVGEW
ncbi:hypothetical protein [Ottowia testudinis]|uniref:Uncharacterized protein n=1 Tax=Ottowia testudinis TaxID=2816950 RepID=A0A975CFX7_9BURK|nr:hypothetical protein [Ottowia testudinis]QTD44829.1 hypothetical protein J1M35_17485 [Ottowia testudinis]